MKKIIALFLALLLIIPSTVAVVVATQDENPDYVIKQMEDVLYLELREAVGKNFVSQSLASRILWIWNQKSESELPQLFKRIMNMLQIKELYTVHEKDFVSLLRCVVNQGYISSEKAREILSLWSSQSFEEQSKLTLRITNLLNSK